MLQPAGQALRLSRLVNFCCRRHAARRQIVQHRIAPGFGAALPTSPRRQMGAEPIRTLFVISADLKEAKQEDVMGRGLLLWLLGIPIPIIILIWVLGGLHG